MYKVKNKLDCPLNFGKIHFEPKETKILNEAPTSDKFHVEKIEETEKKQSKGGK